MTAATLPARPAMRRRASFRDFISSAPVVGLLSVATFLILWQLLVTWLQVPRIVLPAPLEIGRALVDGLAKPLTAQDGIWYHAGFTLSNAILGLSIGAVAGILIGTLMGKIRVVRNIMQPFVISLQSTPKVALAPLFIIWFGFGAESKVTIIALLTFFPLLVNSMAGLRSVDEDRVDLLRSLGASPLGIYRRVEFRSMLPYIFAGLELAVVYALIGAIVSEFVGSRRGLGVLILQYNYSLNIAGTFSVFIVLAVLGVTLSGLLRLLRNRVLFWMPRDERRSMTTSG